MSHRTEARVGSPEWCRLNDIILRHALRPVRQALEQRLSISPADSEIASDEPDAIEARKAHKRLTTLTGEQPPLDRICTLFGLNCFEREVLLLAAAVEVDPRWRRLIARAHGADDITYPTPGLVLAALQDPTWTAFVPSGPLRRWRLTHLTSDEVVLTSRLRLDERVFDYLVAGVGQDESIGQVVQFVEPPLRLVASHQAVVARLEHVCRTTAEQGRLPVMELRGRDAAQAADVAAALCARLGLALASVPSASVPTAPADLERFMRTWEREALLANLALLLDAHEMDATEAPRLAAIQRLLEGLSGLTLVATREPLRLERRPVFAVRVGNPTAAEQRAVWAHALGERADGMDEQIDRLTGQFDLSVARIQAACLEAETELADANRASPADAGRAAWDACRAQAQPRLGELAERVAVRATWDQLVVPEEVTRVLRQMVAHVRQRSRVYEDWEFASRSARGLGISALFAGPSGTGKTMAAEVLAAELRLDLYRIDLSATMSKYIGETEKNLRRIFDAADEGGAVLLFDEADALFGKRSEVKDSHDRYANVEVSYLLQRMEAYRGLAILTTNQEKALDSAFIRRIRFIVRLPFPTAALRATIWRRVFPPSTPLAELDIERLASLNVAGGTIRNIALNAAVLAADEGVPLGMPHLASAAQTEFEKLKLPQPGLTR